MSSVKKLEAAARRGNIDAQYQLAALLASGDAVRQNLDEAIRWYEKAARKKHPDALYNLGFMYLLGEGVEKDVQRGVDLIVSAASNGSRDAEELYADILLAGRFKVKRDPKRGAYFYLKSFKGGNSRAALALASALIEKRLKPTDLSQALLELAADLGVKEAKEILENK